jgi:hypothetical protein
MTRSVISTALVVSLLAAAAAVAGEGSEPASGARIRVTAPSVPQQVFEGSEANQRLVGTLVSLDGETLTLKLKKRTDPVVVPRSSVQQLEISRRSSKKATGALVDSWSAQLPVPLLSPCRGSSACDSTGLSGCDLAFATVVMGLLAPSSVRLWPQASGGKRFAGQ